MCENLHYESVCFKELHNAQEYYRPTMYRAGAAVVSAITSVALATVTAARLAQLGERRSAEREVESSNPGRTNTQGLKNN